MDEAVWESMQLEEYPSEEGGGRHLVVGHLPDRVGLYLLVIEGDKVHIVARVVGATERRQAENASAFLRWAQDREA